MRFGARVFKTGVTVILTLFITNLLGLEPSLIAAIAAVFALQPNVHRSVMRTWEQFQGNALGAVSAITMVLLFGNNVIVIGLTVILVLAILLFFNLQSVSTLAVVTMIAIMDAPTLMENSTTMDFLEAAGIRFSLVMIGVLSSLVVNLLFIPPKYETKMYHNCFNITSDIFKWIRLELNAVSEYQVVKKDIESLRTRVVTLETMYLWYREEKNYFKRSSFADARRKILFRHLIASTRRAFELLRKLNRYENDYNHLDDDFKYRIRHEMDQLMAYHEQIFMKITEKIRPEAAFETYDNDEQFEHSMMDDFVRLYYEADTLEEKIQYENILEFISSIHEYSNSLDRLDRLASSFFRFHADKNKINIQDETLDI
ncbi:FUSC family protein [Salinicoccus luteus]|uniref:FUSC family protein n=1 Tax=Salinicoccus luteus TaxID=367840 RepID=UPI0004E20E51|nr:aromatic acid exporter family protein [Salinicoccus luteus]